MAIDFQWCLVLILLFLPLIYELSSVFRYYAKVFLYYLSVNIGAVFVIILSLWRPCDVENSRYMVIIVREIQRLFGIEIEVRGAEHLNRMDPCVVVSNHQTSLDLFGMAAVWPPRCAALAKRNLQYILPFGLAATLTGTLFVDRDNRNKAMHTMSSAANTIKEKKMKVFIFPEGTRNRDGGIKSFKKGAFHLAVQAQVPIMPLVISSYNEFYSKKERRFDTGKLIITCLPCISTVGLTEADVPAFTERVREQMLQVFNQMCTEVRLPKNANGAR